jgi:hypothetical protein
MNCLILATTAMGASDAAAAARDYILRTGIKYEAGTAVTIFVLLFKIIEGSDNRSLAAIYSVKLFKVIEDCNNHNNPSAIAS